MQVGSPPGAGPFSLAFATNTSSNSMSYGKALPPAAVTPPTTTTTLTTPATPAAAAQASSPVVAMGSSGAPLTHAGTRSSSSASAQPSLGFGAGFHDARVPRDAAPKRRAGYKPRGLPWRERVRANCSARVRSRKDAILGRLRTQQRAPSVELKRIIQEELVRSASPLQGSSSSVRTWQLW